MKRNQPLPASELPVAEKMKNRRRLLELYGNSDITLAEIAASGGVSQSTVSLWAKQSGLPLRGRGRNALKVPTEDQRQILRWLETQTFQQVASKLCVSKAYIGHLVQRWCDWIRENNLRIGRDRKKTSRPKEPRLPRDPKVFVLSFRLTAAQLNQLTYARSRARRSDHPSLHRFARSVLMRALPDQPGICEDNESKESLE
jgi:predicted XRE-type DNA-binding protein